MSACTNEAVSIRLRVAMSSTMRVILSGVVEVNLGLNLLIMDYTMDLLERTSYESCSSPKIDHEIEKKIKDL